MSGARALPSAVIWIFVVSPPRLRPNASLPQSGISTPGASVSGTRSPSSTDWTSVSVSLSASIGRPAKSPFFGDAYLGIAYGIFFFRSMPGSGGIRMGLDDGPVHSTTIPDHLTLSITPSDHALKNTQPRAVPAPPDKSVIPGVPWTIISRQVPPRSPGPVYPKDTVQDSPMVLPRATLPMAVLGWKERLYIHPFSIAKISPYHAWVPPLWIYPFWSCLYQTRPNAAWHRPSIVYLIREPTISDSNVSNRCDQARCIGLAQFLCLVYQRTGVAAWVACDHQQEVAPAIFRRRSIWTGQAFTEPKSWDVVGSVVGKEALKEDSSVCFRSVCRKRDDRP